MKISHLKSTELLIPTILFIGLMGSIQAVHSTEGLEDENLLQSIPDGFKIGYSASAHNQMISEMVPSDETVDSWKQMVTTQIYRGVDAPAFYGEYRSQLEARFQAACAKSRVISMPKLEGKENGYSVHLWMQSCQYSDPKLPPEVTLFKYIEGNDAAYVVQMAARYEPSAEQFGKSMRYLSGVFVCDTRLKDRPCDMARAQTADK